MKIDKVKEYITEKNLIGVNGKKADRVRWKAYQRKYLYNYLRANGLTFQQIADVFKMKCHGTILVGVREYHNLKNDKLFKELTYEVKKAFPISPVSYTSPEKEYMALIELEKKFTGGIKLNYDQKINQELR